MVCLTITTMKYGHLLSMLASDYSLMRMVISGSRFGTSIEDRFSNNPMQVLLKSNKKEPAWRYLFEVSNNQQWMEVEILLKIPL